MIVLKETDYKTAKKACEDFHYSRTCPRSSSVKLSVMENNIYIGVIILGNGGNRNIATKYNLESNEIFELQRVALSRHKSFVTHIIACVFRYIKKQYPYIKAIVSYCDKDQGHTGIIYKAGNWILEGQVRNQHYIINDKKMHPRSVSSLYGTRSIHKLRQNVDKQAKFIENKNKDRYIYFLKRNKQ